MPFTIVCRVFHTCFTHFCHVFDIHVFHMCFTHVSMFVACVRVLDTWFPHVSQVFVTCLTCVRHMVFTCFTRVCHTCLPCVRDMFPPVSHVFATCFMHVSTFPTYLEATCLSGFPLPFPFSCPYRRRGKGKGNG